MIEQQFLIFKTARQYYTAVTKKQIKHTSIAFVVEDGTIRTHGFTFGGKSSGGDHFEGDKKHVFLTQDEYDALEEYDENALYFILESGEEDDPIPPVTGWVFDGYFPVILS